MIHEFNMVDVLYLVCAVVLSLAGVVAGFLGAVFGYFWYKGCFK